MAEHIDKPQHIMVYELIDIDKEKADEILEYVEHLFFETSLDVPDVVKKIIDKYDDPREAFLAGMVFRTLSEFINNKVYKG